MIISYGENQKRWLTGDAPRIDAIEKILGPCPLWEREAYPFSPQMNIPGIGNDRLMQPLETL